MAEIVELFSLETVNKAAAMFDVQKLDPSTSTSSPQRG